MTAWIVVVCIGLGSLTFRMVPLAFAGRATSPHASRVIRNAGAAAATAITVSSFDRAAHTGDAMALAVAGTLGLLLAVKRASMLTIVGVGLAAYCLVSFLH